jgi:hypothetical protein
MTAASPYVSLGCPNRAPFGETLRGGLPCRVFEGEGVCRATRETLERESYYFSSTPHVPDYSGAKNTPLQSCENGRPGSPKGVEGSKSSLRVFPQVHVTCIARPDGWLLDSPPGLMCNAIATSLEIEAQTDGERLCKPLIDRNYIGNLAAHCLLTAIEARPWS